MSELNAPITFDPLRDPSWQPDREDYRSLRDAAVERVEMLDGLCNVALQGCGFVRVRKSDGVMLLRLSLENEIIGWISRLSVLAEAAT